MQTAMVSILVGTDKNPAHYTTPTELSGKNRNAVRAAAAQMAVNVEGCFKCALKKGSNPLIRFLTDDNGNRI
jgi:sulfur relay (sulfurtransferase) complex TusBCD TusD component (DsrE family)